MRAPTYAMITTSTYGKPKAKKTCTPPGQFSAGNIDIESSTMAGTDVTEISAAMTATRGTVGTTTLKSSIQTATHDRPTQVSSPLRPSGWRNSAAAMPYLPTTSDIS